MDKLFYFSKSQDKLPGKGANEFVQNSTLYTELSNIKDWRKILSNFYISPFVYHEKTYHSVEHAFQSEKIRLVNQEKGDWFSLESNHEIGKGDGLIARKNRKLVVLTKDQLQKWDSIKSKIMQDILFCKFSQVPYANHVLKLTKNAELWHSGGREKPSRQYELENVRRQLFFS